MGSALSGVMDIAGSLLGGGGGSGGIGSMAGGIVGGIFGGPIGAALGSELGGMLDGALKDEAAQTTGNATHQAIDQLQREDGMPAFLADEIKNVVSDVVNGLKNPNANPDVGQAVQECCGEEFRGVQDELVKLIVDAVRDALKGEGAGAAGGAGGAGGKPGTTLEEIGNNNVRNGAQGADDEDRAANSKKPGHGVKAGAGSWMQAMAKAMGGAMGEKAGKMVELSNKVSQLNKEVADMKTKAANAGGKPDPSAEAKQSEQAALAMQTQTELQGVGQELSMMQNAFSNAIKSIGEALSQIARKG
jgi:hypothetical protein